jgi:hypothetical protein
MRGSGVHRPRLRARMPTLATVWLGGFLLIYAAAKLHTWMTWDSGHYLKRHWPFWAAGVAWALVTGAVDRLKSKPKTPGERHGHALAVVQQQELGRLARPKVRSQVLSAFPFGPSVSIPASLKATVTGPSGVRTPRRTSQTGNHGKKYHRAQPAAAIANSCPTSAVSPSVAKPHTQKPGGKQRGGREATRSRPGPG